MHVAVWIAQHGYQLRLYVSQGIVLGPLSKSNGCSTWGSFPWLYLRTTLWLCFHATLLIVSNWVYDAHLLPLWSLLCFHFFFSFTYFPSFSLPSSSSSSASPILSSSPSSSSLFSPTSSYFFSILDFVFLWKDGLLINKFTCSCL